VSSQRLSVRDIGSLAGHSGTSSVTDRYLHPDVEMLRGQVERTPRAAAFWLGDGS